jgi:hypothetical protein
VTTDYRLKDYVTPRTLTQAYGHRGPAIEVTPARWALGDRAVIVVAVLAVVAIVMMASWGRL